MPPILPLRKPDSPALRTHKNPISGQHAVGAQFVSFNFPEYSDLLTCVKRKQCFGHGACDEPSCPDRSAQNDLLLPALGHSSLLSLLITGKKQAAGSRRRSPGTHLVLSWSCIQSRWGAADRGHEKTRRGFPPGAHFVSFNFANTPICTTRSTLFFSAAGANSSGNIFRLVLGQMPEFGGGR
jgi:hypothetical protein